MAADPPADRRFRPPLGIFEAGLLLVLTGMAVWLALPVLPSRRAAAAEAVLVEILRAAAAAEEARAARPGETARPFLPLEALAAADPAWAARLEGAGFRPAGTPGVRGNGTYWLTVLLPDGDGRAVPAAAADPACAARGFVVLAWPTDGAPGVLRALAALPGGVLWQHLDADGDHAGPDAPPLPAAAFPAPGPGSAPRGAPPVPFDWTPTHRRPR